MTLLPYLAVGLVLGASGCAPVEWAKPDASPQQAAQDMRFCEQEATREALVHPPVLLPPAGAAAAGGSTAARPADFVETSRLASFCMRSKGYALVSAGSGATGAR